jgi:hypothetical protein
MHTTLASKSRLWALMAALCLHLLAGCGGGGADGGSGSAPGAPGTPGAGSGGSVALTLSAHGNSATTAWLQWTPVAGASGYRLERRSGDAGAWAPVATLGAGEDSYLDDTLSPGTGYSYRLVAQGVTGLAAAQAATRTTADAPIRTAAPAALDVAPDRGVIGPAGGSFASADGAFRLSLPAGAVAAGTAVSLHRAGNPAPQGVGDGMRVRVDALPSQPLTLSVGYDATLDAQADGLGLAVQRHDGSWLTLPLSGIDKSERRLVATVAPAMLQRARGEVSLAHAGTRAMASASSNVGLDFHVVRYLNLHLRPREATIATGASQWLVPYASTLGTYGNLCTPDEDNGCIPSPLIEKREVPFDNQKAGFVRQWFVLGKEGGDASVGTVTPRAGSGAVYRAPGEAPEPNPVQVSFVSRHLASGRSITLTAAIRVQEPVWTMTVRGSLEQSEDIGFAYSAEGVWTRERGSAGTYRVSGTQSVSVVSIVCTARASPDTAPLPPGALVIDRSVQPARYRLDVGSLWTTQVSGSCPGRGAVSVPAPVPGQLVVEGTLGADSPAIEGSALLNGIRWQWALTNRL